MKEKATDTTSDRTRHKCYQKDKSTWGCGTAEEGHPPNLGGLEKKGFLKEMTSKLEPEG